MSEWKTIDSAPKDGTVFLAWCEGMDWPEAVRWIDYMLEDDQPEEGFWAYADDILNDVSGGASPEHWTPLSNPPTE